ncbi:MAG: hypothetical protein AAB229_05595 [Candidatus Hydrogenedentota bacterium]
MRKYVPHLSVSAFAASLALLTSAVIAYRLSSAQFKRVGAATAIEPISSPARSFDPAANIFGATMEEKVAAQTAPTDPPGKLMLLGIFAGGPKPTAMIRNMAAGADSIALFRPGMKVFSNAEKILRIEPNAVVIRGTYGTRSLELGVPPEAQPQLVEASAPPGAAGSPSAMNISRAEVNASVRSPEELIGQSKIVPEVRGGRIVGFKVTVVAENSIVRKMGILPNDVIKAINGQMLDSLERSAQVWEQTKKAQEIYILFERDGKDQVLTYVMRK